MSTNEILTPEEAAARLHLSQGTLKKWRIAGKGPKFIRLGRNRVRYAAADLIAWLEINKE